MDGGPDLADDDFGSGGVELAVEAQGRQPVDEGPHGGKVARTMPRTYSEMAAVAATRSSLVGSQGSANTALNSAGCSTEPPEADRAERHLRRAGCLEGGFEERLRREGRARNMNKAWLRTGRRSSGGR